MHKMDTIIGAAWLRSVDVIIGNMESKDKRRMIRDIDSSFGAVLESFWDSVIENKIEQEEMYQFAFSFFSNYYESMLD